MPRSQLVTLFVVVALVVAGGTYLANIQTRRDSAAQTQRTIIRACTALKNVLVVFRKQEKEAGASAARLKVYDESLELVGEC